MSAFRFILCLFMISLIHSGSFAQGWERIYPNFYPGDGVRLACALPLPGGEFLLLVEDITPPGPDHVKFVTIDANGIPLAEAELTFPTAITAMDMIATSDGGYALLVQERLQPSFVTTTKLLKLDAQFNLVFERDMLPFYPGISIYGKQIIESNAGLCVLGLKGQISDSGFFVCYNLTGDLLHAGDWGLPHMYSLGRASKTSDGGILAIGSGYDGVTFNALGLVATRLNADGSQVIWENIVYEPLKNKQITSSTPAPDGGFLIAGSEVNRGYLIKLDEQGNLLWEKHFTTVPGLTIDMGIFNGLAATSDETGYWTFCMSGQPFATRLDLNGDIVFMRGLGFVPFSGDFGTKILALPNNGCLTTGSKVLNYNASGPGSPYAVRLDSLGRTFTSGVAGTVTGDTNGDCISDVDSLSENFAILAFSNGQFANMALAGPMGEYFIPLDAGNYQITVPQASPLWSFCPDTINVAVLPQDTTSDVDFTGFYNVQPVDSIYGYVFEDYDGDCIKDPFEPGYPNWVVTALLFNQGTFLFEATTDSNGYFVIPDLNGAMNESFGQISIAPPQNDGLDCEITCQNGFNISFGDSTTYQALFGVQCDSLPPCPVMEVDVAAAALRPCLNSKVHVKYCNNGALTAENAELEVTIDPALNVLSSNPPWTSVSGNVYTFLLGDLLPEACDKVEFTVKVPCTDPAGTTYCFEAHAYPDTLCQDSLWSGPQVEVSAACIGDSVVFTIQNVGMEDMTNALEYIVIEDNVLLMQVPGQFQLNEGEILTLSLPANGAFFRLEAEQITGFPGLSKPIAWVEGCNSNGGTVSLGFVNQYPLPNNDPWLDIFCLESVNSYDPNDKNGFPRGYAAEHFIEENTDIEYLIRFQNTGTAPALDIEIRDTIPVQHLNPLTVRPGASSHPYTWDMQGDGVVVFRFPGINLPDSASNQELSQGFVKFRVSQHPDLAEGTEVLNTAAIYFDNNDPVITNQTLHTIGRDFITLGTQQLFTPGVQVQIMPNPMSGKVRVFVRGLTSQAPLRFRLMNQLGQPDREIKATAPVFNFNADDLARGIYFYEIWENGHLVATGKLLK